MPTQRQNKKPDVLNKLLKQATNSLKKNELISFKPFLNQFFHEILNEDRIHHTPEKLFNIVHKMWHEGNQRKSNTPLIKASNPSYMKTKDQNETTHIQQIETYSFLGLGSSPLFRLDFPHC